ncbi:UNVERIFIED_CONTAM: hypothetical protein RMT77_016795 [Armadillidium vulgare]
MLILFLMLIANDVEALSGIAFKVPSPLPIVVNGCLLRSFNISGEITPFFCISSCQQNPPCLLACSKGMECNHYYANISPYWSSDSDEKSYECFSIWAERNDIASELIFETTKPSKPMFTADEVNDGIGCQKEFENSHAMGKGSSVWAKSDMKFSRKIKRVIVQTMNYPGIQTFFSDVEVRVGNYNGTGDFSANTLLGYYKGPATDGEIITFENGQLVIGRFLSIQNINGTGMAIIELKVIAQ